MKIYLLFLLIISLLGCGGGGSGSVQETKSVELNGDSLMYGESLNQNIPTYIKSKYPNWTIDSRAVGGLSLKSLVSGYSEPYSGADKKIYPRGPQIQFSQELHVSKIIVLEFGANDAYNSCSVQEFESNLRSAIKSIYGFGSVPVLVTIPIFDTSGVFSTDVALLTASYNVAIRKIGVENSISIAELDTVPFVMSDTIDGIHRTQAASNVFGDMIISAILAAH